MVTNPRAEPCNRTHFCNVVDIRAYFVWLYCLNNDSTVHLLYYLTVISLMNWAGWSMRKINFSLKYLIWLQIHVYHFPILNLSSDFYWIPNNTQNRERDQRGSIPPSSYSWYIGPMVLKTSHPAHIFDFGIMAGQPFCQNLYTDQPMKDEYE